MPKVVRLGDVNSAGGATLRGDPTFIVDGKPVSPVGTPVSPHAPCPLVPIHCSAVTTQGDQTFIIGGINVTVVGSIDSCGHPRVTGSETFIIGGI